MSLFIFAAAAAATAAIFFSGAAATIRAADAFTAGLLCLDNISGSQNNDGQKNNYCNYICHDDFSFKRQYSLLLQRIFGLQLLIRILAQIYNNRDNNSHSDQAGEETGAYGTGRD